MTVTELIIWACRQGLAVRITVDGRDLRVEVEGDHGERMFGIGIATANARLLRNPIITALAEALKSVGMSIPAEVPS